MSDIRGIISKYNYYTFNKIIKIYSTIYQSFICYIYGIELGENVSFVGRMKFVRNPNTVIQIGNNCIFLSKYSSNLIGINKPCIISTHLPNAAVKIGDGNGFSGTVIGAFSSITIGNNVKCGANTLITDSNWHLDDSRSGKAKPIIIKDNVWLGVNSVVLKGVTIGENSVIGANSVVVRDIPPNTIASGNPCKVLRKL